MPKIDSNIMRCVHTAFFSKRRKKGAFCKHIDKAHDETVRMTHRFAPRHRIVAHVTSRRAVSRRPLATRDAPTTSIERTRTRSRPLSAIDARLSHRPHVCHTLPALCGTCAPCCRRAHHRPSDAHIFRHKRPETWPDSASEPPFA